MTIEVLDEYLPLFIKALDNQHVASQVLNRQDDRYRDISRLFKDAVERKRPDEKRELRRRSGGRLRCGQHGI